MYLKFGNFPTAKREMKKTLLTYTLLLLISFGCYAQSNVLQSGPMVGYSTMKEVMLWAQTNKTAEVKFVYWDLSSPTVKQTTGTVTTLKEDGYTARVIADQLEPGKTYGYQLYINNKLVKRPYKLVFKTQPLWQYRTDPPPFKFVIGSCNFINEERYDRPGKPYGGEYEIFESIYKEEADFMVWMGDNTYLREPDWNSWTGILHRYTHTRSTAEMQPVLGSMHHYATWDDHDFGPNDSDRSFWNKGLTTKAFKLFWANPNYNVTGKGGITGTFFWNDVQFFLLDDRYFRIPEHRRDGTERTVLGEDQIQWLIDAITFSRASFKFIVIGSQVLNTATVAENYANYPKERQRLIDAIWESKARGVIFLDGDRHHSVLSVLDEEWHYPLYDLTVSPLTAGVYDAQDEKNHLKVPGTLVAERNYGLLEVSGPRTERILTIKIKNKDGQLKWEKQIKASDLK